MRILIFGVTGMLGHALWSKLKQTHDVFGTLRRPKEELRIYSSIFKNNTDYIIDDVDALDKSAIDKAITLSEPDVIINCIGIIKQIPAAHDPIISISINSLFPHVLAKKCHEKGIRLIHISTDCVFSGKKGSYTETDISDAEDLYGRTKYLGEISAPNCLTIRTSLIGRELSGTKGLLEWFLSQNGKQVKGYQNAVFSGLTTYAMSNIIQEISEKYNLEGLYHISSEPVTKYDLLNKLKQRLSLDIEIVPDKSVFVDRSLDSNKFRKATAVNIPSWDEMADDLAIKIKRYYEWR